MFMHIIRTPDVVSACYNEKWELLQKDNEIFSNNTITVSQKIKDESVTFSLHSPSSSVEKILIRWKETCGNDKVFLGDHWERAYGDLSWRGIVPEKEMPWYFFTSDKKTTDGYGVKTGPSALCCWFYDGNYVSLLLDVRSGGQGVQLLDRTLEMATVITRQGSAHEDVYEAMNKFCAKMCDKPLLPSDPIYGGNNWYYAYGKFNEQDILMDSKLLAEVSEKNITRPFMVLDDGWQVGKTAESLQTDTPWLPNTTKFPDIKSTAKKMKEIGVRPGIWYRPLLTNYTVDKSLYLNTIHEIGKTVPAPILDPSKQEVLDMISSHMKQFKEWGFELVKHDFTTFDCMGLWGQKFNYTITPNTWTFADSTKTTAEIYKNLYKTIQEASGDMLVIGCNTFSHLSAGYFEINRTGDDTSGLQWERTRRMGVNTLAFRMSQHNAFYAVDADCVGITENLDWDLNKQWLDVLSKSGTPLFVSADYKVITEEQKKALKEAFSRACEPHSVSKPLDFMSTSMPQHWVSDFGTDAYNFTQKNILEQCSGYLG